MSLRRACIEHGDSRAYATERWLEEHLQLGRTEPGVWEAVATPDPVAASRSILPGGRLSVVDRERAAAGEALTLCGVRGWSSGVGRSRNTLPSRRSRGCRRAADAVLEHVAAGNASDFRREASCLALRRSKRPSSRGEVQKYCPEFPRSRIPVCRRGVCATHRPWLDYRWAARRRDCIILL